MKKHLSLETTSASLHIIAMVLMLGDHLWGSVIPGNDWLTCFGRVSFPIFAFLVAEGYRRTSNFKKYLKRIFIFALISEIPFNLMSGGSFINPFGQNVLWTFLIALVLMRWLESSEGKAPFLRLLHFGAVLASAYLLGTFSFCNYGFPGVLTVLVFALVSGKSWHHKLLQFLLIAYINFEMFGGFEYLILAPFGEISFPRQGFAVLALIPIWLYKGKKGESSRAFRAFCYWFFPVHMAVIGLIGYLV